MRGDVSGSLIAVAIGALAMLYGIVVLVQRRRLALLGMLVTGGIVYVGTRAFAQIHVQAKALAVIAPLALLVALMGLLERRATSDEQRSAYRLRFAIGTIVLIAAALSTLIALRDAPIGFDERQLGLEQLADRAAGKPVAFLGVDRFAGYYLRKTLARAPAGYVPRGDRRPSGEDLAAGPRRRLRLAGLGPARQVRLRDHDQRRLQLHRAAQLPAGRARRRLHPLAAPR